MQSYLKKNDFKSKTFKPLLRLRENILNNEKLLKFKKKKWVGAISYYVRKLKRFKKYKPKDQKRYLVTKQAYRFRAYNKIYKDTLTAIKKLKVSYGGLPNTQLKKIRLNTLKKYHKQNSKIISLESLFIKNFEMRLDTVLFRAKFCSSFRAARQLIIHKKVFVNNKLITSNSYKLNTGDLISLNNNKTTTQIVKQNNALIAANARSIWPHPPKHLTINYKTLQIIVSTIEPANLGHYFFNHLELERILIDSKHK